MGAGWAGDFGAWEGAEVGMVVSCALVLCLLASFIYTPCPFLLALIDLR